MRGKPDYRRPAVGTFECLSVGLGMVENPFKALENLFNGGIIHIIKVQEGRWN